MKNLFKDEVYLVSAVDKDGKNFDDASALMQALKRAALTDGFQIASHGLCSSVGEIGFTANTKFDTMQDAMDKVSAATNLSLFLSNREDIVGTRLIHDAKLQRQASFLRSGKFKSEPI